MNNSKFTENNFDLLRLLAAFQVVFHHSNVHLGLKFAEGSFFDLMHNFPGVPVFFFISGYLISKSYDNSKYVSDYAQNRVLRIYPALVVCFIVSFISVYLTGYFTQLSVSVTDLGIWFSGQLTFLQFYNPDFMRGYGVGVLNGSLWTIAVELQFYVLTPILYFIINKIKTVSNNSIVLTMTIIFVGFNVAYNYLSFDYSDEFIFKLIGVSFVPWFYMFLFGVLVQMNFTYFYRVLSGRVLVVLVVYLAYIWVLRHSFDVKSGNSISPFIFVPLALLVFSTAYSYVTLSKNLLRKNDISYGLYIYHMPVINLALYLGYDQNSIVFYAVLFLTFVVSVLSWVFIERPSLALKRHPLNPLNSRVVNNG